MIRHLIMLIEVRFQKLSSRKQDAQVMNVIC